MSDPFIFLEAFMEGIGNGGCMYAEMVWVMEKEGRESLRVLKKSEKKSHYLNGN